MDASTKACYINVGYGHWYPQGSDRLMQSMNYHGWNWNALVWKNDYPHRGYPTDCVYNIKAAAFEEALIRGFSHVMWLDCSFWAIKDPNPIMDIIDTDGYYLIENGQNCAQECSDKCLQYFGVTRDEAEQMQMCSSGILGINYNNPIGKEFITRWMKAAKDGIFSGSRFHDGQSKDPRFLHHRQDQSAASIILNQLGMKLHKFGDHVSYYSEKMTDTTIFSIRGM